MSQTLRTLVLRANALFLTVASTAAALLADIPGIFFARGPLASIGQNAPQAGIGFLEAHGLALIFGVLFWRASSAYTWHFASVAVHLLLGTCNLIFWEFFVSTDSLAMGYVTTSLHWLFVVLQLAAAAALARGTRKGDSPLFRSA